MSEVITASEIIRRQNSPEQKDRERELSEVICKFSAFYVKYLIELVRKKDHCLRQVLTSAVIFREIPREQAIDIEKTIELTDQLGGSGE